MDTVDIAWFAGIFEGEGCFTIEKNGNTRLIVGMCDKDIIDRIKAMFPIHQNKAPVQPKPVQPRYNQPKIRYTWCVSDPGEVKRITELILPWLGERRTAKANEVLKSLATRRERDKRTNKTHCRQGHELTPDNIKVRREGDRTYQACKTCWKVWYTAANRRVSEKKKAARATAQSQSPEQ